MEMITLNNGVQMPQLGLGTFLIPNKEMTRTIGEAFDLGYRQFDTAWKYQNETAISQALKANCIRREDVFLTTKINAAALTKCPYNYGKRCILNLPNGRTIKDVIQESFDNLGTDYIDLFLIHYPYPNADKMWRELENLYNEGRIRAIGVSNFLQAHLEALSEITDIVPAVNQFEISPLNTQKSLIKYCQEKGIVPQAMSTFSHFRSLEPRKEILESDLLLAIATKYNKSVVQVVLRWLQQQGIILIPKTWNSSYLKENIEIFDFELTDEEMGAVDSLDGGRFLNYDPSGQCQGFFRKIRHHDGFRQRKKHHFSRITDFVLDALDIVIPHV